MEKHKPSELDRRQFVKTSALAMGGLMVSPALMAKAHSSVDDAIKIGLIGCGGRGTGAAVQALLSKQNVRLVAMADAFRDNLDKSFKQIKSEAEENDLPADRIMVPEEHKFSGFDGYQKVIPLCDVVVIATPPGFRPIHFEACVQAGKHVFMEKPVAVDAPGVRRVLKAAEMAKAKKLNVVVGLQRHYQKIYTEWVDAIHGGAIGDIVGGQVYWNGDGVWVRERKPGQTEMEYQMRNWYYFNWLCGDHIVEQHIHNMDVANWVLKGYPVKAQGMGGRQVRVGKEFGEIFDHHFVELEYADGTVISSQCRHIPGTMSRVTEAFTGTNGTAPKPGLLKTHSGYAIMDRSGQGDPNPYQVEHDMLFAAIAKGEYKYADAENGAKSTMTAIFGRMATYSGKSLSWDEAINSEIDLSPAKYDWNAQPQVLPDKDGMYACAVPGKTRVI